MNSMLCFLDELGIIDTYVKENNMIMLNLSKLVKVGPLFFFLIFFLATVTNAATYYIRTDGSNSNNGLTNSARGAWRTIDFAADHVSAGDVIRVQTGTYGERVTPAINGSSVSNTVTFVTDGSVTVCGFDFSSNHHIRVIGFTIDTDEGGCSINNGCVNLSGLNTYLEFWHNTFRDARYQGIRIASGASMNNSLVIGNIATTIGIGNYSGTGFTIIGGNNLVAYNEIKNIDPDVFFTQCSYTRFLNNYAHNMLEEGGGHPDFSQNGNSSPDHIYNLYEANFQAGAGTPNDHVTNWENSGGARFTENIFRRNVWHNLGSGTIGMHSASSGISNTRYYHNTTAESQEYYVSNTAGFYMYRGIFDATYVSNNIEYESWGSSIASGIEVYYIEDLVFMDYNLAYDPDGSVTFRSPWTSQSNAQTNADPDFDDYNNDNFHIGSSSKAIGAAGHLTTTYGSGTGTTFNVAANGGGFFRGDNTNISQYSGNLVDGDIITVGNEVVKISSISGDAITVTESFTWADGENVYYGDDTTPDIGAYPYKADGYDYTATYTVSGGTVTLTPSDVSLVRMVVVFEEGVPIGADSNSPFSVTGVGSGELVVRVYPLYACSTLYVDATPQEEVSSLPPANFRFLK
jgi:hypothetical protein